MPDSLHLKENDDWEARCAEAYQILGEVGDEVVDHMGGELWIHMMDILSGKEMDV